MEKEEIRFTVPAQMKRKLEHDCYLQDMQMGQLMRTLIEHFLGGAYIENSFFHKEKNK